MNGNSENKDQLAIRYKALIEAKMNYLYHKKQMNKYQRYVDQNLTVQEHKEECFSSDSVATAFKLLGDEFHIEKSEHVRSKITFKDIEVCLHDSSPMSSTALKCIVKEGEK